MESHEHYWDEKVIKIEKQILEEEVKYIYLKRN